MTHRTSFTTTPSAKRPLLKRPLVWVGLAGTLALLGGVILPGMRNAGIYRQGETAYQAGDCKAAIAQFDRLQDLNATSYIEKASAHRAECEKFVDIEAQQANSAPGASLVSYSNFLIQHPQTALSNLAQQRAQNLFQQHSPEQFADATLCPQIGAVFSSGLMPTPDTQIPALHFACGNEYVAKKDLSTALSHYYTVLNEHPDAAEIQDVEAAIARTLVSQANEKGAGRIPPPLPQGSSGNSSSVVKIRNNSPKTLRIVFSGPEPQFVELPPCTDCQVYSAPVQSCPEKGAIGTYTLKPGQYSVLVRAADDSSVTPFTGDWSMQRGKAYTSCFYLVRRRG